MVRFSHLIWPVGKRQKKQNFLLQMILADNPLWTGLFYVVWTFYVEKQIYYDFDAELLGVLYGLNRSKYVMSADVIINIDRLLPIFSCFVCQKIRFNWLPKVYNLSDVRISLNLYIAGPERLITLYNEFHLDCD